ncbi:MAG: undecaprenyl-diphosphate phosphatase [Gammaproteobacteria bacterium]|nr:undecaprenyl-diphosphate phosphatase [Gammaproteobacteria bacterium]
MEWLQIIVLSLIQGLTEFLPVSSSAHLILPSLLTDWPDQGLAFDIAVHAGSLLAVLAYFRSEMAQFAISGTRLVVRQHYDEHTELLLKIIVATLPVAIVGYALKDWVATELRSVLVIAASTMVFAVALWWGDRHRGTIDQPNWLQTLLIGSAQVLAIVPGTSRSGLTITAALLLGLSRTGAARFSFLLSIPTIFGAALLATLDLLEADDSARWTDLALGTALAALCAYACIHYFIALVERTGMMPYVIYRLLLGVVLVGLVLSAAV